MELIKRGKWTDSPNQEGVVNVELGGFITYSKLNTVCYDFYRKDYTKIPLTDQDIKVMLTIIRIEDDTGLKFLLKKDIREDSANNLFSKKPSKNAYLKDLDYGR